ncbi:WD40 repeat-like protein, partial [Obba rivulosa]
IQESVPHIYISALPSIHMNSKISKELWCKFMNTPILNVQGIQRRRETILHIQGHTSLVSSVAFSPDGSRIVSCSHDETIRVWDANTDGSRIVSCSRDRTIRVWNANTGEEVVKPLEVHTDWVSSVAFSPDGSRVVSCSYDETIRVCDVELDNANIKTHAVAFSPYQPRQCRSVRLPKQGTSIVTPFGILTQSMQSPGQCPPLSQQPYNTYPDHSFEPHSLYEGSGVGDPRDTFSFDSDSGWIRGPREELVLWVPDEYRSTLWWPRSTLIIGRSRVSYDMSRFVHGMEWVKCYTP